MEQNIITREIIFSRVMCTDYDSQTSSCCLNFFLHKAFGRVSYISSHDSMQNCHKMNSSRKFCGNNLILVPIQQLNLQFLHWFLLIFQIFVEAPPQLRLWYQIMPPDKEYLLKILEFLYWIFEIKYLTIYKVTKALEVPSALMNDI